MTPYHDAPRRGPIPVRLRHAVLLRNNLQRNHWIRIRLEGSQSNRDAIGAVVRVHTADGVQVKRVRGGSGFLSKEPCELHFGLGRDASSESGPLGGAVVTKVEILWPSGRTQTIENPAIDQLHEVREPQQNVSESDRRVEVLDHSDNVADRFVARCCTVRAIVVPHICDRRDRV